jgi:sporulation-control protein spo0M
MLGVLALAAVWWIWSADLGLIWSFAGLIVAGIALQRSYRAFIEFWRYRLSERVEISITPDKDTCLPGDAIRATVQIEGKEQLDIQEGRAVLVCANRYVYKYTSRDSDGDRDTRTREVTEEVVVANERILEERSILPGSYSGHDLTFHVPLSAPPSATGKITSVEWKIRVTLAVRRAPDVFEEFPLTVLSTSASYASWAEQTPELDSAGACGMEFRLSGRSFRVGERIEGTLVLAPHRDFKARALRVELVRREIVPRASGNTWEVVLASQVVDEHPMLQPGSNREYAFSLDVPEAAGPSLKTDQTYVGWWLRAVVDLSMALDYELNQLLNVYNGPTTTADHCPERGARVPQGVDACAGCGEPVSRHETPLGYSLMSSSGTLPAGQVLTTVPEASPQQQSFAPPQAPPSGPKRNQKRLVLILFAVVAALIFVPFLLISLFSLLVLLAS